MTIVDAIKQVMHEAQRPLTAREAFTAIIDRSLYQFHAKDPLHVVTMQIRRHCSGLEFPSAAPTKHFQICGDDRYSPLSTVIKGPKNSRRRVSIDEKKRVNELNSSNPLTEVEKQLWALHANYLELFEEHMLRELKRLTPAGFEVFARDLLDAYGFTETVVTSISRDGGIDGHGKLRVGLAHLNVAFQCKRWTNGNIQRPEIDKFRGASQGAYEQGIFFTTSSFSKGAIGASIQRGAIPVVLIDGVSIVRLMVEKKFRVESNTMDIPAFAL